MPRRAPALPPLLTIGRLIASASNARSGGSAGPATALELRDGRSDARFRRLVRDPGASATPAGPRRSPTGRVRSSGACRCCRRALNVRNRRRAVRPPREPGAGVLARCARGRRSFERAPSARSGADEIGQAHVLAVVGGGVGSAAPGQRGPRPTRLPSSQPRRARTAWRTLAATIESMAALTMVRLPAPNKPRTARRIPMTVRAATRTVAGPVVPNEPGDSGADRRPRCHGPSRPDIDKGPC